MSLAKTWCVGAWLALCLTASSARADVTIAWDAPASCSDLPTFQRAFERAMGTTIAQLGAAHTQVHVSFSETERGWHVRVQVDVLGVSRTRELTVQSHACHRLDEGVLVVVGLLVDEVHREAEAHPIQLPEPSDASPVPPPQPPSIEAIVAAPVPVPASPETLTGAFILGARTRVDALPGCVVGVNAGGELQLIPELRLGIGVELYPEATSTRPDGSGAHVSALAPYLSLCGLASPAPWLELGGCAGVDVVLLEARGIGLDEVRTARGLEMDVLAEARLNLALTAWLWVHLTLGVGIAPVRARVLFHSEDRVELLHVTSIVFPTVGLAWALRLGT